MALLLIRHGRLPARCAGIVMPFLLSVLMTCVVSGVSTLRVLGFTGEFLRQWPAAWALSWIIAFPTLLVFLPLARRLTAFVVAPPG